MDFRNHTPFPAMAFEGIDPENRAFHVVVLRQTLTWDDDGQLDYADEQAPLCEVDTFFGEMNQSSLRQESDLCHYKPKCDIIVNATAHAPKGRASRRFPVRLTVRRPDTPAPLPDAPQPLNPYIPLSLAQEAAWHDELEKAKRTTFPGAVLIDKTLTVTGPRCFKKKWGVTRLIQWAIKWSTLTLIRPNPWKLTRPGKIHALPLRYEHAWGGQCRINERDNRHLIADDPKQQKQRKRLQNSPALAKHIPNKYRLTPEQLAGHPDLNGPVEQLPVAHVACEHNPVGTGFAAAWFLKATRQKRIPAPQIENPQAPITARRFWQTVRGKLKGANAPAPAGFGIRHKGHPQRRVLLGTVDESFIQGDVWLPADFDFAIWNAAPADQQTDHLLGDECVELTNLCALDTPGARRADDGSTHLCLQLPRHDCFALLRMESGEMNEVSLPIDTLLIEPETCSLTLVWRLVFLKDDDAPIRVAEAGLRTFGEREALTAARETLATHSSKAAAAAPADGVIT